MALRARPPPALDKSALRLDWIDAAKKRTRFLGVGARDLPLLILKVGAAASLKDFALNITVLARHFRVVAISMRDSGLTD